MSCLCFILGLIVHGTLDMPRVAKHPVHARNSCVMLGVACCWQDDELAVDFVTAASNLRAACYGIPTQSVSVICDVISLFSL